MVKIVKAVHEKSNRSGISIHDEEVRDESLDGM